MADKTDDWGGVFIGGAAPAAAVDDWGGVRVTPETTAPQPTGGEFNRRQRAYREALHAGSPDLPAGSGAVVEDQSALRHTPGEIAGKWGQFGKGVVKGVPASIAGGVVGDVEEMARHAINRAGRTASSPGDTVSTKPEDQFIPPTTEGGYLGPHGLGVMAPAANEDEKLGMGVAGGLAPQGAWKLGKAAFGAAASRAPRAIEVIPPAPSPRAAVESTPAVEVVDLMSGRAPAEGLPIPPWAQSRALVPVPPSLAEPREGRLGRVIPADVPHEAGPARAGVGADAARGPLADVSAKTLETLREIMREAGFTPHTIEQWIEGASQHQILAEATPNLFAELQKLAVHGGESRNLIHDTLMTRAGEAKDRIKGLFDGAFGERENLKLLQVARKREQSRAADPLYRQFKEMQVPSTQELVELMPRLEAAGAFSEAKHLAGVKGVPWLDDFAAMYHHGRAPTAEAWDLAKQGLDAAIEASFKDGQPTKRTRAYMELKKDLINAIENHPDKEIGRVYREAREAFAGPAQITTAEKMGQKFFQMDVDDILELAGGYSSAERAGYLRSVRKLLQNQLGSPGRTELPTMRKMLADNTQEKLRAMVGDVETDRLIGGLEYEYGMHFAPDRVLRGSDTAVRTASNRYGSGPSKVEAVGEVLGDIAGMVVHPKKGAAKFASKFATKRETARLDAEAQRVRNEIAPVFLLQGPERDAVLRYLVAPPPPRASGGRVNRADGGRAQPKIEYNVQGNERGTDRHELRGSVPLGRGLDLTGRGYAYPETNRAGVPVSPGADWGASIGLRKGFALGGAPDAELFARPGVQGLDDVLGPIASGVGSMPEDDEEPIEPVQVAGLLPPLSMLAAGARAAKAAKTAKPIEGVAPAATAEAVVDSARPLTGIAEAAARPAVQEVSNPIRGASHEGQPADEAAAAAAQASPEASVRKPGGDFGVAEAQAAAARARGDTRPLEDLPQKPITIRAPDGDVVYVPGPVERIHQDAADYMRSAGRKYEPLTSYRPVDVKRAERIAEQYERMPHAPNDPAVQASYNAMIDETMAQFDHILRSGLKIEFIKPGMKDPYEASPRLAQMDVRDNNHLWVFPTDTGFGANAINYTDNPLLRPTGVTLDGHDLLANDAFRIVHDYFGHIKDGVGFRGGGEENAWRSHARMYSPLARRAMTTETRGQNSWLNYGPHGAANRTAKSADTVFAEQKTGLLPGWVEREGAADHFVAPKSEAGAPVINAGVDAPASKSVQTVADPYRMMYPGIYENPKRIAREAAERVAPEDIDMKRLWGVSRGDLDEMAKTRKGNQDPDIYQGPGVARGALSAQNIQTPKNTQRLLDILAEAGKYPGLRHADAWYIMDPVYWRMVEMFGPEQAKARYKRLVALMGMASPASEVLSEIQRGTAANMKVEQGRFDEFLKHAGTPREWRKGPRDLRTVDAHPYHRTSQAEPMQRYLETGKIQSREAKVPAYVQASGTPETGFQTRGPVADSHFSRGVGLADTRRGPTDVASSASRPEYHTLQPWWEKDVAAELGLESVPAQARLWTALGPRTGVSSALGQGKLELLTKQIMITAGRLGVAPEGARDLILSGKAYAGRQRGGAVIRAAVRRAAGGEVSDAAPFDSSWVNDVPDQDDAGQAQAAREAAARGVARGVQHRTPLGLLPSEGDAPAPPEAFPRKTWMIAPDLQGTQSGDYGLPPGAALNDAGQPHYPDTGKQIEVIPRPGMLPFVRTPEGIEMAMPKLLDLAANVMSPLAAGRVPVKAGEMVLGSGAVRTSKEAKYPLAPRSEWHGEANYETTGGRMTTMTPDEFLKQAKPLDVDDVSRENIDLLKKHIQEGKTLDPLQLYRGGKEDGRHRAIAAKELGINEVPVINFREAEKTEPFYSTLERAVETAKLQKGSPQQWLGYLRNQPGVKPDELDWRLGEALAGQPKKQLAKEEVAQLLAQNRIEVNEVARSERAGGAEIEKLEKELADLELQQNRIRQQLDHTAANTDKGERLVRAEHQIIDEMNTRHDRIRELANSDAATQFTQHMEPGGKNQREFVMTLAMNKVPLTQPQDLRAQGYRTRTTEENQYTGQRTVVIHNPHGDVVSTRSGTRLNEDDVLGEFALARADEASKEAHNAANYRVPPGHAYGDPHSDTNRFAHVFTNDADIGGKKYLNVAELQGDWAQAGQHKGFKEPYRADEVKPYSHEQSVQEFGKDHADMFWHFRVPDNVLQIPKSRFPSMEDAQRYVQTEKGKNTNGVPDFPLKNNWHEIAMKRMIRRAIDEGYDGVSWASGQTVADRYDLSRHFKDISYIRKNDGNYSLFGSSGEGHSAPLASNVPADKLPDYVGKGLAEKIAAGGGEKRGVYNTFSGVDLTVGGEFHKKFYDAVLPRDLGKIVKKFGAKVETGAAGSGYEIERNDRGRWQLWHPGTANMRSYSSRDLAEKMAKTLYGPHDMHVIHFTPEFKARVLKEGFSDFARGGAVQQAKTAVVDTAKQLQAKAAIRRAMHGD